MQAKNYMFGNMSKISRVVVLVSAFALALVFVFPIWSIDLWAPQYPEGLGMKIWLDKMTGDIDNINLLNHYIGMHRIVPDEISELKIFIYLFSGLIAALVAVALIGKRIFLHFVTLIFIIFSFGALYDFYQWEYKYGHELNPEAAIKIEGASYQPPLIGTKELMNIEATSWPDKGGMGHLAALLLVSLTSAYEIRSSKMRGK